MKEAEKLEKANEQVNSIRVLKYLNLTDQIPVWQ